MRKTGDQRWWTAAALAAALLTAGALPAAAGERSGKTAERPPVVEQEKVGKPHADAPRVNAERDPTTKPVTLYGNKWYRGVDAAVRAGTQKKKPILLVRMLGELDEKT